MGHKSRFNQFLLCPAFVHLQGCSHVVAELRDFEQALSLYSA